jgi:hypothetical protein
VLIPGVQVTHDPVNHVTRPVVCPVETARGLFLTRMRVLDTGRLWTRYLIRTDRCRDAGLTGQAAWWGRRQEEAWVRCCDAASAASEWRIDP